MKYNLPRLIIRATAFLFRAPGILIDFNQHIAFGTTNAMRDVLDYYEIKFKDKSKSQYLYNGKWNNATQRLEEFVIRAHHR
jgi:penicillin amidase